MDGKPFEQKIEISGKIIYIKKFKEELNALIGKLGSQYFDF